MDGPEIRRLYYSATEVCEEAQIEKDALKQWEIIFPAVKPVKSRAGRRLFKPRDLELIIKIKEMKEAGFRDDKIRSYLETIQHEHQMHVERNQSFASEHQNKLVREIERTLNEIVEIINSP